MGSHGSLLMLDVPSHPIISPCCQLGPPNMGSHLGSRCSPNQGCPPPPCSHHLPPLLPLLPPNPPRALGPLVSMGVGHDFGVPPSVPMAVGRVADQAHHFRRLDLAVGRRVALALVVTEDAVLQRAPAPAELCGTDGDETGGNEDTHGHPWSAGVTHGHPTPPMATRGHQWPLRVTHGHPWPSMATHDHFESLIATQGHP